MAVSSAVDVCRTHAVTNTRRKAHNQNAHAADRTRIGIKAILLSDLGMTGHARVPVERFQVAGFCHIVALFMYVPPFTVP
jgi:hypothetical protein